MTLCLLGWDSPPGQSRVWGRGVRAWAGRLGRVRPVPGGENSVSSRYVFSKYWSPSRQGVFPPWLVSSLDQFQDGTGAEGRGDVTGDAVGREIQTRGAAELTRQALRKQA